MLSSSITNSLQPAVSGFNRFGGNILPSGYIFHTEPDGVDTIGLSVSDKASVRAEIWALLFDENDDPYDAATRITNIEDSDDLNNGKELGGNASDGYFLYPTGTSFSVLRKAYRWAGETFVAYGYLPYTLPITFEVSI